MATYNELRSLFSNDGLRKKIEVAVIIAAETIRTEDVGIINHTNRLIWAKQAFNSPRGISEQVLMAMLASNKGLSIGAITGASDTAIQTNVDAAVDVFADGS